MLVAGHNNVVILVTRKIRMRRDEACLVRDENGVFVDRACPVPITTPPYSAMLRPYDMPYYLKSKRLIAYLP